MKKVIASFLLLFIVPAFALADGLTSAQIQIQHLTAIAAALQAQATAAANNEPLACAALASKSTVAVNEPFALAWGSVGAVVPSATSSVPMWTQNGVSEITIQQPGTWKYSFTFYSTSGQTTTCNASIVVGAAQ